MVVHILAAGPSIQSYQKDGWPSGTIIATNGVGLICPHLNVWCACDLMPEVVVTWVKTFIGYKFCSNINSHQFDKAIVIKHWPNQGPLPFEEAEIRGMYWHGSVAMMAAEIARLLFNAKIIIIHGLDYKDTTHAYDFVDKSLIRKEKQFWDMPLLEMNWKNFWINYQRYGIELYNANPNSTLQALPKLQNWREPIPERVKGAV